LNRVSILKILDLNLINEKKNIIEKNISLKNVSQYFQIKLIIDIVGNAYSKKYCYKKTQICNIT